MAARSIANGAYLTLMHLQSASRRNDWYRIALDRRSRQLSCDCAAWLFFRGGERACKHTRFVAGTLSPSTPAAGAGNDGLARPGGGGASSAADASQHAYVQAIQAQFPGFLGHWAVVERHGLVDGAGYRITQIQFTSGDGETIDATIAFADAHGLTEQERRSEIAIRAGYCIALELAHRRGIDLDVRPPSHYSPHQQRTNTGRGAAHSTRRPAAPVPDAGRWAPVLPSIALDEIVRIAGTPAEGRTPTERAEGTLRLMLGDETYGRLLRDGYLDVPSRLYANRKRVYRLRRDPHRNDDKRVRIFEEVDGHMSYVEDYCIVRASYSVPEADHYLTKWLGLLSDERSIIGVVARHNRFRPHSDDYSTRIEETTLPVWRDPRGALVA